MEAAHLNDIEQFILEQRVAHRNIFVVRQALLAENIEMSELQIREMMKKKIPRKLANAATAIRLECEVN